jgi:beta-xylosidase
LLAFVSLWPAAVCAEKPAAGAAWRPDNGDGTYKNPILFADYSDPDVVRVGEDFYLVSSSFSNFPGLPVLHSRDLVNWTIVGHAVPRYPFALFDQPQHGNGIWAPAIRFHNGEYYIYYGDPDLGIFMTKTRDPAGEWEPLVRVWEGQGRIDACPFWDDDGQAYLVHAWAKSRAGFNSILTLCRMSPDGTRLLDEGQRVFDGTQHHPTIEGPKFYKRNGYYYIFAPAGGVKPGWQTVLRSKNIDGPYEDRVVLAQGATDVNGPHQGALLELPSGEWWFVHFQDRDAYGRIVHLQPVKWVDDWPVIGDDPNGDGTGQPVATHKKPNVGRSYPIAVPQTTDEFDAEKLGLQWQWQANPQGTWASLAARPGWLRLWATSMTKGAANLWPVPNLLLQKFPAEQFTVTTRIDVDRLEFRGKAGLVVMGTDYTYLAVEKTKVGPVLVWATCEDARSGGREAFGPGVPVGSEAFLQVEVQPSAVCQFSYSNDGEEFEPIGQPFVAKPGRWIGAKVGLFCIAPQESNSQGYADFDWFRIE